MTTFESLNLSEQLLNAIKRLGFEEPTQIQRESIPLILKGRDIIGESATGSGKTLAFGAGIIEKCNPKEGIQALVLVPTRELAEQVKDDIHKLAHKKPIKIIAIYGGVAINPQMDNLKRAEVVIATPGRLLDHLNRRTINTSKVKILVLDEADRMVEMGFINDVEKIIRSCPRSRQTLIFSATMYGPAKQIAKRYMEDPATIHATKMVDPTKLKQAYYKIPSNLKKELLVNLLQKESSDLVMVFCNTRRATDMLVDVLRANNVKAAPIHGGLNQVKRLKTIDMFHNGKFQILICTDVAARGLHIQGVTHIYNFDIPKEPSDYVHRIGRTARAGKEGVVINIVSPRDKDDFARIVKAHKDFNIQKEEKPELKPIFKPKRERGSSRSSGDFHDRGSRRKSGGRGRARSKSGGYGRSRGEGSGFSRSGSEGGRSRSSRSERGGYSRDRSEGSSYGRSRGESSGYSRASGEGRSYGRASRSGGHSRSSSRSEGGGYRSSDRSSGGSGSRSESGRDSKGRSGGYGRSKSKSGYGGSKSKFGGRTSKSTRSKPRSPKRRRE